VGCNVGSLPQA